MIPVPGVILAGAVAPACDDALRSVHSFFEFFVEWDSLSGMR
jgi:hypothetical protein